MNQIKINKAALEAARKQFCLDTCLEWQQYLESPQKKCYIQRTVYGEGSYPAFAGARKYSQNDSFFKAIMCMGQLFLCADGQIYDWAVEKFGECEPEWFCEYENLRRIDEKLREYGRKIADTHIYFLPGAVRADMKMQEEASLFPLEWYETEDMLSWKESNRFRRALGFSPTQPDRVAVAAMKTPEKHIEQETMAERHMGQETAAQRRMEQDNMAGMAGVSESHTVSQTVALKAEFVPAWTEIYVKPL